jgi:non-specific serine/threonine protein kinase
MNLFLFISPHGHLYVESAAEEGGIPPGTLFKRIEEAFHRGTAQGILHLATVELETGLPASYSFAREWGRAYLTQLCHRPESGKDSTDWSIPAPSIEELNVKALSVPPMRGGEYLTAEVLAAWWVELDTLVREGVAAAGNSVRTYMEARNPLWRMVGRVTFHLAENKRDPESPFAFLATYSNRLSAHGQLQHLPLERALREYGAAKNRPALLSLLEPIQQAAERVAWVKELVDSGEVYEPMAWGPEDAYRFLRSIPDLEAGGLIVRVPDWWKSTKPPRPVVNVKVGGNSKSKLGVDSLLAFSVDVSLNGETLSEKEIQLILASSGGLVSLKGQWVELDSGKLAEALQHWKKVECEARGGGISFFEGMRLLAGASLSGDAAESVPEAAREWVSIAAGGKLESLLGELQATLQAGKDYPPRLQATLRPYQQTGVQWLRFLTRLGLGACLADDMGLGKTVQVIGLLLHLQEDQAGKAGTEKPSLLVVPASLIANWKSELARFSPSLSVCIAHPSESGSNLKGPSSIAGQDLVITTYTMLCKLDWLRQQPWKLAILDEAQAIKNSGVRQTHAVKELIAEGRIALTGTPIENRLSDLWSLFDFLNPGLLGSAKDFTGFVKQREKLQQNTYGPLRTLVRP